VSKRTPISRKLERARREASIKNTVEALEGKLALLATLEAMDDPDPIYLHQVRSKVTRLRARLVIKNACPEELQ
jgi:hypothetical protein